MSGEEIIEYGHQMSSGGFQTFIDEPYIEKIYPLADRLQAGLRFGGHVWKRRIVVIEDWEEITAADVARVREAGQ